MRHSGGVEDEAVLGHRWQGQGENTGILSPSGVSTNHWTPSFPSCPLLGSQDDT